MRQSTQRKRVMTEVKDSRGRKTRRNLLETVEKRTKADILKSEH